MQGHRKLGWALGNFFSWPPVTSTATTMCGTWLLLLIWPVELKPESHLAGTPREYVMNWGGGEAGGQGPSLSPSH